MFSNLVATRAQILKLHIRFNHFAPADKTEFLLNFLFVTLRPDFWQRSENRSARPEQDRENHPAITYSKPALTTSVTPMPRPITHAASFSPPIYFQRPGSECGTIFAWGGTVSTEDHVIFPLPSLAPYGRRFR